MNVSQNVPFKVGYVAIVGLPNVGKSTLMNQLLGARLSIVTPKPQTTRHSILGILSREAFQVIFLDTPGLIDPKYSLQKIMRAKAEEAIKMADVVVWLFDASQPLELAESMLALLRPIETPKLAILNKIDLVAKPLLLPQIDQLNQLNLFKEIIPISALYNDGIDRVLNCILQYLPTGEPFYAPEQLSDRPERFFIAELIREQIFLLYGEEIPYATTVQIEEYKERPKGKDYIRAVIFVEQEGQKAILIGKNGEAIKRVGQRARENIEAFLGKPVYLELFVRVKPKWRKEPSMLRELGYE